MEGRTAHEINQQLRGHNYLYIDFLMTWKFASVEGVRYAIEYFLINIKLINSFLKLIATNFDEVLRKLSSF